MAARRRTRHPLTVGTVLCAALAAGCGASAAPPSTGRPATASAVTRPTASATPSATPWPAPEITGDADVNPACKVFTVAEVERITGQHVTGLIGVTTGGQYGGTGVGCTWHLASTDIQAPGVDLQYEVAASGNTQERDYLRSLVDQKIATPVAGVGDVAEWLTATTLTLDGTRGNVIFHVRAQVHDESVDNAKQRDVVMTLTKLALTRLP